MRVLFAVVLAAFLSGCVTGEKVTFQASASQQSMMRDGQAALVSRGRNSIVSIRPAARGVAPGDRPVFVVNIENMARIPLNFRVAEVEVTHASGAAIPVLSYEQLAQEETNKQIAMAVLAGVAAGANSAANARSRNYWVQRQVAEDNAVLMTATVERGRANLAALEATAIKDHTLMPGEVYGGQLHLAPPADASSKAYTIALLIGPDRHDISVAHQAVQ